MPNYYESSLGSESIDLYVVTCTCATMKQLVMAKFSGRVESTGSDLILEQKYINREIR